MVNSIQVSQQRFFCLGFSGLDCSESSSTVAPSTTTETFLKLLVKLLTDIEGMDTSTIKQIIESIMPILTSKGFVKCKYLLFENEMKVENLGEIKVCT